MRDDVICALNYLKFSVQEYKPPMPKDLPIDLRVTLLKNAPNPLGVLRSKGSGLRCPILRVVAGTVRTKIDDSFLSQPGMFQSQQGKGIYLLTTSRIIEVLLLL